MGRRALKRGDAIIVLWQDAVQHKSRPGDPALCKTMGFFVTMDETRLTVVTDWFQDGEGRDYNTIPKGMVSGIRRLSGDKDDGFEPIDPTFHVP